jgi:hypothetical protein
MYFDTFGSVDVDLTSLAHPSIFNANRQTSPTLRGHATVFASLFRPPPLKTDS